MNTEVSNKKIMKIAVLGGDGIGPEVTAQSVKVLRALEGDGLVFQLTDAPIGQAGVDAAGVPLPDETLALVSRSDAILFGAVGAPTHIIHADRAKRPGAGILKLRKSLDLYANLRPAVMFPEMLSASTLRPEIVRNVDMLIIRELTGDLYFGEPRGVHLEDGKRVGINTMRYSEDEVSRIGHIAFQAARKRRGKVCSVDKANVLETMQLWREVMIETSKDYPDVELTHLYIDAASMTLIRDPASFDVVVTGNVFGDILSDAAAMLTGSIGMLPSASLGAGTLGLFEPVHGSAPDIAGKNIANPIASVLSTAMMLRHSLALPNEADRIEGAVRTVLANGYRTGDIHEIGKKKVGTDEMGNAIVDALRQAA
jgi:3-isopropylmalate dehydrogenase